MESQRDNVENIPISQGAILSQTIEHGLLIPKELVFGQMIVYFSKSLIFVQNSKRFGTLESALEVGFRVVYLP